MSITLNSQSNSKPLGLLFCSYKYQGSINFLYFGFFFCFIMKNKADILLPRNFLPRGFVTGKETDFDLFEIMLYAYYTMNIKNVQEQLAIKTKIRMGVAYLIRCFDTFL